MTATQNKITRNRDTTTCLSCRTRKLRCDRANPCASCVKRGEPQGCKYQKSSSKIDVHERKSYAEERLVHLENLVRELSSKATKEAGQHRPPISSGSSDTTDGVRAETATRYNGPTHWSAMLEDIYDLRDVLSTATTEPVQASRGGDVILGMVPSQRYVQVLENTLPPRQETDRLVAAYFRSRATLAPFIHTAQFGRLYESFWGDPAQAPPLWTSMLFSMCHAAHNTLLASRDAERSNRFSVAAAHCLVAGRYHQPKRFAIEAFLMFLQAECITSLEIPYDVGTLFGLMIRPATRMGYHRDPESLPISPFEKEMRRRAWSLAFQLDLLISFQLGLPSNIQYPTWNTQPPTSLMDYDFDEDTAAMPPARPFTTATDILFYIAKHRLMVVFEKILRHAMSQSTENDLELRRLDDELRKTYAALPEILRPRPMANSVVDASYLKVTRLCVVFIYDKCLCVLHRGYAVKGRPESVQVCYDACTDLLGYFCDAYVEFRLGGQHDTERWFMGSITWADFLLSCMVLCMVFCVVDQQAVPIVVDDEKVRRLLQRSLSACVEQSARSNDTQRVKRVLEATIARLDKPLEQPTQQADATPIDPTGAATAIPSDGTLSSVQYTLSPTLDGSPMSWDWLDVINQPLDDPAWLYLDSVLELPE